MPTQEHILDSTLDSVDLAESIVSGLALDAGISEDDVGGLGMAIRECVANAVVHGNRYSAKKKVRLTVGQADGQLEIVVTDEGEGFALEDVPDPLASENMLKQSGRGILLIRAFVDQFDVRKLEPNGTEVRMVKYLPSQNGVASQG
jgi:serine/threonine-protein kinase RsbW